MLHFLRDNVVSGICRLTEPDVTFFFARKIVSEAGYVIAENLPKIFRCDYEMALLHGSSGGMGSSGWNSKKTLPKGAPL